MRSSSANPRVSSLGWLAAAFAIVWIAIGAYVVVLARAQRTLERRLDEIERAHSRPPAS